MIDAQTAADMAGVKVARVYHLAAKGKLPEPASETHYEWHDSETETLVEALKFRAHRRGRPRKIRNTTKKGKK